MMIEKPIESFTEADLRRLVNEKVSESETLDYKLEMYAQSDSEKREMLRDVSSMANARGGHILIGLREEDEVAVEVVGIEDAGLAAERLLSSCLSGVQERINGLNAWPVPLSNGRAALVVFVPPSLRIPHMVIFQNEDRCWVRHGRQKLRMSVDELRDACLRIENLRENTDLFLRRQSARWSSRADQHREKPLLRVAATPIPVDKDRVDSRNKDLRELMMNPSHMRSGFWAIEWPLGAPPLPTREGLIIDLPDVQALEVFRSGHLEFRVYFNRETQHGKLTRPDGAALPFFSPEPVVEYTVSALRVYRMLANTFGILDPVVVSFEIFDALGWGMLSERAYTAFVGRPMMESDLGRRWKEERHLAVAAFQVPEVGSTDSVAQTVLDRAWNCFGYENAPFFNTDGMFAPPAR